MFVNLNFLFFFLSVFVFQVFGDHGHSHSNPNHNHHHSSKLHHHHQHHGPTQASFESNQDDMDADALLGGKENLKDFANLSPEEARKHVHELIEKFHADVNKDNFIDLLELISWVERALHTTAYQETSLLFAEQDEDKDGYVTWEEHFDNNIKLNDFDEDEMKNIESEDLDLWSSADQDKDGKLNKTEYGMFISPEDHQSMIPVVFKLVMKRKDLNKDGKLSFDEFIRDEDNQIPDPKSETFLTEKDRFEKDLDQDHNGFLEGKEIEKWFLPNHEHTALVEAEHLMELCDDNNDNKLSLDELAHHITELANSELTDFGSHLSPPLHDEL